MEYQELKQTKALFMVRQDIINGEYILTDHILNYGKLVYDGLGREEGNVYAAGIGWKFGYDFEPFGKAEILIYNNPDTLIGKATSNRHWESVKLIMNDGFIAKFEDPSIFLHEYEWTCKEHGTLLRFKVHPFSLTDDIHILNNTISIQLITLLCFLSSHILILKKRHSRNPHL
jgi:hypothetical protein